MRRSLVASDALRDVLRHLPPALKHKVRQALDEMVANPVSGKPLRDELLGLFSYRLGRVRIIYRVKQDAIILVTIGPRPTVYQKAALELKQQLGSA